MTEIANFQFITEITFFADKTKKEWIKSKKYADFGQIGKISVKLNDEYYENGENAKIWKIYYNFTKIWTEEGKLT